MGITGGKQRLISSIEVNNVVRDTNPLLEEFFYRVKREEGIITLDNFQAMTLTAPDIAQDLYELCSSSRKMYLNDLKYFYTLFASSLSSHKISLFALLLFSGQEEIQEAKYIDNAKKYLSQVPFVESLLEPHFIKALRANKVLYRSAFIEKFPYHLLNPFSFVKKIQSSKVDKFPIDNSFIYRCECLKKANEEKPKEREKEMDDILEVYNDMKGMFMHIERMNSDIFPIKKFEEMMKEVEINPLLIKAISIYLRKKTMNSFIDFDTFRDFIIRFALKEEERVNLLFEILSYPNKDISLSSIKEFFPSDSTYQKKTITREDFNGLFQEEETFKVLIGSMYKINSIPYLYFGLKPMEPKHKKITLDVIMRGLSFHDFLLENIAKETEFYCIDAQFVKDIEESFSNTNLETHAEEPIMKLSKLSEEKKIKSLVYKEDFFICTNKVYQILSAWFKRQGYPITFKKIIYDEEKASKSSTVETNKPKPELAQTLNGKVHEIDLHPISVTVCSLESITRNMRHCTMENLTEVLNDIKNDKSSESKRLVQLSRKDRLIDLTRTIKIAGSSQFNTWIYYNNRLYMPELNNSYEDEGIVDSCIMMLDLRKGNACYFDYFKKEEEAETKPKDLGKESNTASEGTDNEAPSKEESEVTGATKSTGDSSQEQSSKDDTSKPAEEKTESSADKDEAQSKDKAEETTKKDAEANSESLKNEGKDEQIPLSSKGVNKFPDESTEDHCSPLGIINIGNSCYMNAVLQIIINMPILKDILLMPYIPLFINKNNKLSNKGLFISELINIIANRWAPDREKEANVINPKRLKLITGSIHPQFNNNDQQDANEFMTFLLDECNEEINVKASKVYIPNPDQGNNTTEELSNIFWANAMRRSTSFINSLFLFQLQNKLVCSKCQLEKISFDTSNHLFLPIPMSPTISLRITINRLPFEYKTYYHLINASFKEYMNETAAKTPEMTLSEALMSYYALARDEEESFSSMSVPIQFEMDVQRKMTLEEMLQKIRDIAYLQLEPLHQVMKEETIDYSIEAIQSDTYLSVCIANSSPVKFYHHKLKVDSCFQDAQSIVIYELLNSNGISRMKDTLQLVLSNSIVVKPLLLSTIKCDLAQFDKLLYSEKPFEDTISNVDTILASMTLPASTTITPPPSIMSLAKRIEMSSNSKRFIEHIVPIQHCTQKTAELYLFNRVAYQWLKFPEDYLIVNNSNQNLTARMLYNFIWSKYKRYFKDPNKIQSKLWWNCEESLTGSSLICYPFHLKWSQRYLNYRNTFICSKCPFYHFCNGCIIEPYNSSPLLLQSSSVILVNWCSSLQENELMPHLFNYSITKWDLSVRVQENFKEKTLDDCIDLFFEKESLDDKMACDKCKTLQSFTKSFQIDKVPHVLVISLNRFKYVAMHNKKIQARVDFPLRDLTVKSETYDLYGVIYHLGEMNYGHYTAVVKMEEKWMYFDDGRYMERREGNVVTSEAYILVYISRKDINECDYYKMMMSMMDKLQKEKDITVAKNVYEPEWFFGLPVNTPKGEGYFIEETADQIVVYLNKEGKQSFQKKEVVKQIQLTPSHNLEKEELKEIVEINQLQQQDKAKGRKVNISRRMNIADDTSCLII